MEEWHERENTAKLLDAVKASLMSVSSTTGCSSRWVTGAVAGTWPTECEGGGANESPFYLRENRSTFQLHEQTQNMFILYFTHARHLFLAFPSTQEEKNKQYISNLTISQKNMVVNTLIQISYEVQVNWTFSGNLSATDLICFLFFTIRDVLTVLPRGEGKRVGGKNERRTLIERSRRRGRVYRNIKYKQK